MVRGYLLKRVGTSLFILWVVITFNFIIFRVVHPIGDPSFLILDPNMPAEVRTRMQELWGIDQPLFPNQYGLYLFNLITWQYGNSFGMPPEPIAPEMVWRLRNTLVLLGIGLVGTIAIGLPLGVLAGSRRGKKTDVAIIGTGLLTWGLPSFFLQLLFLLFFAYYSKVWFGIQLMPFGGVSSYPPPENPVLLIADVLRHAAGPVITLILLGFGSWALYTRNMIVDTLTEDFIMTARAKGVKERDVLYKHAFHSILPPIATMVAMAIPGIVTGAIITETIFSWPGIGQWYILALNTGNHPVTQAVLYNYAFLMILANLISDILYGFLDPRIKVGSRR
jgi:peptide/nickel transport system permease protein